MWGLTFNCFKERGEKGASKKSRYSASQNGKGT